MNMYKIAFISEPDPKWVEAANRSLTMPSTVETLLTHAVELVVSERQLDAICEWDRSVAKAGKTQTQLDYWPVGIRKK